jgi:hypothetical protein
MQKLHPRFGRIIVPFLLTFMMTFIISGMSTFIAIGVNAASLKVWPLAWFASWLVAFPAALFVLPLAQWLTSFVVRKA